MTITDETNLSMNAGRLNRSAMVYTRRNTNAPTTMPKIRSGILPLPKNAPPMRSDASATVTMPVPISMLTDFCDCASKQPESAVNALEMHRPMMVVLTGLMDEERTMSGLLPVARIARPRRVRRKSPKTTATSTTVMMMTISLYCPASGVFSSTERILVKTVSELLRFRSDAPFMMPMLTE